MIFRLIYHIQNWDNWEIVKRIRGWYYRNLLSQSGANLRVADEVRIYNPRMVTIGSGCYLGTGCQLYAWSDRIIIGNNVLIAAGVKMITRKHNFGDIDLPISVQGYNHAPITIEDNVWIGFNVVVLPGVSIGRNSIIGAGAVVTRSIPANSIVGGVPARVIKLRSTEF